MFADGKTGKMMTKSGDFDVRKMTTSCIGHGCCRGLGCSPSPSPSPCLCLCLCPSPYPSRVPVRVVPRGSAVVRGRAG